jgi:pimeloyl-ACP methyl ester carboxylesterase
MTAAAGGPVRQLRSAAGPDPLRVLLLHGLGGTSAVWRTLADRAPAGLQLWTADLPWGLDTAADWVHDPDVGQWIVRALAAMPAGRADVVVAHSFAATALLDVLDRAGPPRPRALVLVSPFYRARTEDFDWLALRNSLDAFPRLLADCVRLHVRRPLAAGVDEDMARHLLARIGAYGWARFLDLYLRTPRLRTSRLDLPVLAISGERDDAASPADGVALARALPDCRLEIFPGCGHFPMAEQPDRFARLVAEFLTTVAAAASAPAPGRASTANAELLRRDA